MLDELTPESAPTHPPAEQPLSAVPRRREQPEFDGVVLAILLAVVSIGYGTFLTVVWRQPIEIRAGTGPTRTGRPSMAVGPVSVAAGTRLAAPAGATGPDGPHRTAGFLSSRSLTALWKRRDTRSLERAFTGLREQTLAFHRCGMRKTGDDRAVARCEGSGATWTIDFQRHGGRWQIANVVTR